MEKLLADISELQLFRFATNQSRYDLALDYLKQVYACFDVNDKYVVTTVESMYHLGPDTQNEWDIIIQMIYDLVDDVYINVIPGYVGKAKEFEEIL